MDRAPEHKNAENFSAIAIVVFINPPNIVHLFTFCKTAEICSNLLLNKCSVYIFDVYGKVTEGSDGSVSKFLNPSQVRIKSAIYGLGLSLENFP